VEVVSKTIQRLRVPEKTTYIGKGKLDEIIGLKSSLGYNVVIFDDELTPLQQRILEEALSVKIIDRAALILDIFARAARTREGRIQVELAQHQYLLPRLAGQWQHLERLGGGIGTRGPGESQLETDRRLIKAKIARLEKELEQVRKHRSLYREHRKKSLVPVIALVGYTNVGKSTLLNVLTGAGVPTGRDKLFSTLDPITRRIRLSDNRDALVTDTVGFIRKLPPTLVAAFRATLEELDEADLLLHVVDISVPNATLQSQTVEDILKEMNLAAKPRVTAVNKIDRLLDPNKTWDEKSALDYLTKQVEVAESTVLISAAKGWGLNDLLAMISKVLPPPVPAVQSCEAL